MACVGLDIRPQLNNYSKPNFAILLAQYWKDTNTTNERENVTPKAAKVSEPDVMAKSLEKAKVVQEWASAIEVLACVDGSAGSISSIRALIDGVMESAAGDL